METRHDSVLLAEAVDSLMVATGDTVVDATIGGAGHFSALLARLNGQGTLIGIDADAAAIARAESVTVPAGLTVRIVHDNFRNLDAILDEAGIATIDRALFDLGWSSFQLTDGRGLSFRANEPLDMTYGKGASATAADMVNNLSETSLADLIYTLGEERFSRGIARAIVEAREEAELTTTFDLVRAIEAGVPSWYKHRRLHPATKTFQALRIAVNDELGALREGLTSAITRLSDGGRIAVITFHSIEDRIVKSMLRDAAHAGQGCLVTKKPIVPGSDELSQNPRARSAKLRVFERCAKVTSSFRMNESATVYA